MSSRVLVQAFDMSNNLELVLLSSVNALKPSSATSSGRLIWVIIAFGYNLVAVVHQLIALYRKDTDRKPPVFPQGKQN